MQLCHLALHSSGSDSNFSAAAFVASFKCIPSACLIYWRLLLKTASLNLLMLKMRLAADYDADWKPRHHWPPRDSSLARLASKQT